MTEKERCNEIVGKLFTDLDSSGLRRKNFSLVDLITYDFTPNHVNLEKWTEDERRLADVVHWLQREGAIYVETHKRQRYRPSSYLGVQLTSKGAVILAGIQVRNQKSEAVVTQYNRESRKIYSNLGELIGAALGSFTKSVLS